jgi:hypothetical protein
MDRNDAKAVLTLCNCVITARSCVKSVKMTKITEYTYQQSQPLRPSRAAATQSPRGLLRSVGIAQFIKRAQIS